MEQQKEADNNVKPIRKEILNPGNKYIELTPGTRVSRTHTHTHTYTSKMQPERQQLCCSPRNSSRKLGQGQPRAWQQLQLAAATAAAAATNPKGVVVGPKGCAISILMTHFQLTGKVPFPNATGQRYAHYR